MRVVGEYRAATVPAPLAQHLQRKRRVLRDVANTVVSPRMHSAHAYGARPYESTDNTTRHTPQPSAATMLAAQRPARWALEHVRTPRDGRALQRRRLLARMRRRRPRRASPLDVHTSPTLSVRLSRPRVPARRRSPWGHGVTRANLLARCRIVRPLQTSVVFGTAAVRGSSHHAGRDALRAALIVFAVGHASDPLCRAPDRRWRKRRRRTRRGFARTAWFTLRDRSDNHRPPAQTCTRPTTSRADEASAFQREE